MKKALSSILLLSFLLANIFFTVNVYAESCEGRNYNDAVDGSEIRWGGSAKYYSARDWAINRWNELETISICPDLWNTYEDLAFYNSYNSDAMWVGQYSPSIGTCDIYINNYHLDQWTNDVGRQRNAYMHEIGHALGLVDHLDADEYTEDVVMYEENSALDTLSQHDIDDYYYIWGY